MRKSLFFLIMVFCLALLPGGSSYGAADGGKMICGTVMEKRVVDDDFLAYQIRVRDVETGKDLGRFYYVQENSWADADDEKGCYPARVPATICFRVLKKTGNTFGWHGVNDKTIRLIGECVVPN